MQNKFSKEKTNSLLIPPHSPEAERSTLGSLMIDEQAANKVVSQLNPPDFYEKKHQLIYETMLELYEKMILLI